MTRISSLFVASTLALLPIGAFAQTTVAPGKTTAPTGMTSTVPTAGVPTAGVPTAGVPTAGVPTAGVPTAGVPTAGVPTAGVPTAGVPTADKTVAGAMPMDKTAGAKAPGDVMVKAPGDATTTVTQPAVKPDGKSDAKGTGHGVKNDVHGMNGVNRHHAKVGVPAKAVEPSKS